MKNFVTPFPLSESLFGKIIDVLLFLNTVLAVDPIRFYSCSMVMDGTSTRPYFNHNKKCYPFDKAKGSYMTGPYPNLNEKYLPLKDKGLKSNKPFNNCLEQIAAYNKTHSNSVFNPSLPSDSLMAAQNKTIL